MIPELAVKGFISGAVAAGIRYQNRFDLAMIHSLTPAAAAGVFTTNTVKAAPVVLGIERLRTGRCQTILVNSGIANACTGAAGMEAALQVGNLAAARLGIAPELVQVASTGVIGAPLPVARFESTMDSLVANLSPQGLGDVAKAIMTTDTVPKTAVRTLTIAGTPVTIAGIAKGAGMIMPNMATMLGFVLTDAAIAPPLLSSLLKSGAATSFNAITIDGDTSTNDTLLLLANGAAGNTPLTAAAEATAFREGLDDLLRDLALQIVRDGEGATKLISLTVAGAVSAAEAEQAARTVANSCLVKTAFFGEDANWGRIVAALGRSEANFDPGKVDIAFGNVPLVTAGVALGPDAEKKATAVIKAREFPVHINLHAGNGAFTIHTCDLSIDYIKINADYRS